VRFAGALAGEKGAMIARAVPLYDVGRAVLPEGLPLHPEALTPEQLETMKTHTTLGLEAVLEASLTLKPPAEFLRCAKEITLSHEERWDGSGYPQGLSGDDIPVSARLVAIADGYDLLISAGLDHGQAMVQIAHGKGTRFDPDVADAFAGLSERIAGIAAEFAAKGAAH
jgi:putative two-component system response regulator